MKSYLKHLPQKNVDNSKENNIPNGNDAEIFASSNLLQALGCEISWGSRNEDGRKIDLFCSFDHPWVDKERIILLIQVKSGRKFGVKHQKGFKLTAAAKNSALRTTHPICVVWVDRMFDELFWAYIHPNTKGGNQLYGEHHVVNPAMLFDITRCQARNLPIKKGGKGLILNTKEKNLSNIRENAINEYVSYKNEKIFSPALGEVECTRIGWRHMFRKTRSRKAKDSSLKTIPLLKKILEDYPTSIYVSTIEFEIIDGYMHRKIIYILNFNEVTFLVAKGSENEYEKVVVKLIEEIRWPSSWRGNSVITQRIDRTVKLQSCYYK